MLTVDEARNVALVYRKLIDGEDGRGWGKVDDALVTLDWLHDSEIVNETYVQLEKHRGKKLHCGIVHEEGYECFVSAIVEAVDSIVKLYSNSQYIHEKNRYVLSYYLAMSHVKLIKAD